MGRRRRIQFVNGMSELLREPVTEEGLLVPFSEGRKRAWLFEEGVVHEDVQTDEGSRLTVCWTPLQQKRFKDL